MAVPHYGVDLIKWALSISRYTENRFSRGFSPRIYIFSIVTLFSAEWYESITSYLTYYCARIYNSE